MTDSLSRTIHPDLISVEKTGEVKHLRAFCLRAVFLLVLLACFPVFAQTNASADRFESDLKTICSFGSRMIGNPGYEKTIEFIQSQMKSLPGWELATHEFDVVVPVTQSAKLTTAGSQYDIFPFWPAAVRLNATPTEGIEGKIVYIASDDLSALRPGDLRGQIAAIESHSDNGWISIAAYGPKAILVLGSEKTSNTTLRVHEATIPINLPRYFVPAGPLADQIRSGKIAAQAKLEVRCNWEKRRAVNIYALLKSEKNPPDGWDTKAPNPGVMLLTVPIDSVSLVPDLSFGASQAIQPAAAISLAKQWSTDRPKRPIVIAFTSADGLDFQGTRQMFAALSDVPEFNRKLLNDLTEEETPAQAQLKRLRELKGDARSINPIADRELIERLTKIILTDGSLEQDKLFAQRALRKDDPKRNETQIAELERRQIVLSQLRYYIEQKPAELSGEMQSLSQSYLSRLEAQLNDDPSHPGLVAQCEERRARLNDRIRLYKWLAESIGKNADPSDRSNNSRLIECQIGLDLSDGGNRVGPVDFGQHQRKRSVTQIQNYREWFTRQFTGKPPAAWATALGGAMDIDPINGMRASQSWLYATMAIPTEMAVAWGVPGFSLITLDDLRFRRDTPIDTFDRLDLSRVKPQLEAVRVLLSNAWNDISFKDQPEYRWQHMQYSGQVVSGAPGRPVPDLPRGGFVVAAYNVRSPRRIPNVEGHIYTMGLRRLEVQMCDAEGKYRYENLPRIMGNTWDQQLFAVQAYKLEPGTGEITSCSDLGKQAGDIKTFADIRSEVDPLRNVVFECDQISLAGLYDPRFLQDLGEVIPLDARRNAEPQRYNIFVYRQLATAFVEPGSLSHLLFRYGRVGNRLLMINMPENAGQDVTSSSAGGKVEQGRGFDVESINTVGPLSLSTAHDFYRLDSVRLEKYRRAGVSSSLIDSLHKEADEQLQAATTAMKNNDGAGVVKNANGAWANEALVYKATTEMASDVIRAAIFLLLLCVPFSVCMERLIVAATSIYKQIAWTCVIFAIMTALLWSFHPAFKISSSPLIIILSFAIIFMSLVVISVVYGKFDTELKKIRSGRGNAEGVSFASASVLMSAVMLGIANMRKRKFRTLLTSTTVVLITFAVLCFTSASKYMDVSTLPAGVNSDHPGIMLRQRGYRPMPPLVVQNLRAVLGAQDIVERWWNLNAGDPREMIHVSGNTAKVLPLQALLGLSPGESKLSHIAEAIGAEKFAHLENGEDNIIYLAKTLADQVKVKEGDTVRIGGIPLKVTGVFDADEFDQKVTMLSGDQLAPLKYTSGALDAGGRKLDDNAVESLDLDAEGAASELSSNYEHLSATQFAIVPASVSRKLPSASLRSVAMRFSNEAEMKEHAKELSRRFSVAMFAGYDDGVRMVVASDLASISGAKEVAIPLAIAGLIIFNTMMGSIAERRREIHVYTSLGLAPLHVGALFVAEAMTYGLIGTVFGYVGGQGVGTLFQKLGWLGGVTLNYSGTSAMMTMGLILIIVLLSALVPARLASKIAAPSIERSWRVPLPKGDEIMAHLPFTINKTAADGALAYLADFFDAHKEGSIGKFSAGSVETFMFEDESKRQSRGIKTTIWLTPFDLGVRQHLMLLIHPGEFPDIYEVQVVLNRLSGDDGSWYRMNRSFLTELRKQFLQWRSLTPAKQMEFVEASKKLFVVQQSPTATAA